MQALAKFNEWRNQEVYIPLPKKRTSKEKQGHAVYEITPSLSHDNKEIETFIQSLHMVFDTSRVFINREESFGLEIYADDERISYYFATPEQHKDIIHRKLQHTFKGSGVSRFHPNSDYVSRFSERHYALTLGLKEHSFLPINMHKDAKMFHNLINFLEHLQKNEKVFLQIMIQPVNDDWQEDFRKVYQEWLQGENPFKANNVKEIFKQVLLGFWEAIERMGRNLIREDADTKERRRQNGMVQKKLSQLGFKFEIRAIVDGDTYERKQQIARAITTSFRSLSKENDFVESRVFAKKKNLKQMQERRMKVKINNQLLCTQEVANLFKFPDSSVDTEKVKRMAPEERRVDSDITEKGMLIGESVHAEDKLPVSFSTKHLDDISRIKLFVASPGSGKSTIIEQLVYEAAKLGHGSAIFDIADGSLYERIIAMNPEFKDRIIAIDYADEEHPPAINFSALGGDEDTRGLMFSEFFEVFFNTNDLARTQSYLLKAAMTVFSQPDTTLLEFVKILRDEEFRNEFLPKIRKTNPDLYLWWMKEFPKIGERRLNEIIAPILVRLDHFLYNVKMRNLLCQKGGDLNPKKWMDEGKIVIFNLSNGTFTESEQRVLMSLHNMMFWNATLAREKEKRKGIEPRPFHLFYDEPQTYMGATPMFSRAVSKARKYRVSLNFFIQEAEQVIKDAPALWKEFMGMSPHLMIGPVSESTAKHVKSELDMSVEEILSIKKYEYHWILKTYANKKAMNPVVIKAVPPRDSKLRQEVTDTSHAEEIKKECRYIFSKLSKSKLRTDISARNMSLTVDEYHKLLESYSQESAPSEDIEWE